MGFWHGAQWTCMMLGILFAITLCIEKLFLLKVLRKLPSIVQVGYTITTFMFILISVRAENMEQLVNFWKNMVGLGHLSSSIYSWQVLLNREQVFWLIVGIIFSIPIHVYIRKWGVMTRIIPKEGFQFSYNMLLLWIFFLSITYLAVSTYNPFIYFRF
jgi:alginate O-acetyltransferase complex protein AlgI